MLTPWAPNGNDTIYLLALDCDSGFAIGGMLFLAVPTSGLEAKLKRNRTECVRYPGVD